MQREFFLIGVLVALIGSCTSTHERKIINEHSKPGDSLFHDCPPSGDAKPLHVQFLNRLKNRESIPQHSDFDTHVSLSALLQRGNDKERWNTSKAATLEGYVIDVKPGGKETCNCHAKDLDLRDAHIELVTDPMHEGKSDRVVVEVSPRLREHMRAQGVDWSTRALRDHYLGRWVRVSGWLFFDSEHEHQSENTEPGRERNWRATAWELHPITSIEVIDHKR